MRGLPRLPPHGLERTVAGALPGMMVRATRRKPAHRWLLWMLSGKGTGFAVDLC